MMADNKREKIKYILRLAIGIAIILFLFLKIDLKNFPRISEIHVAYFLGAVVFIFLDRFVNIIRWSILIHSKGLNVSFLEIAKIYFKSNFLGLVIPSGIGGEVFKGYGLYQSTSNGIDSFSSIIVERVLGLLALISICTGSYYLFHFIRIDSPVVPVVGNLALIILLSIAFILILGYFCLPLVNNSQLANRGRIVSIILKIWISFYDYRKEKGTLFTALLLSFLIQIIRVILTWCAGMSLGVSLELSYYFFFVPFIALISMIPLSLGGLGIQEGAFVYFFSLTGVSPAKILAMAILVRILIITSVSPGGIIFLREGVGSRVGKYAGKKETENLSR